MKRYRIIEIFRQSPSPTLVLRADSPDFTILEVNHAYETFSGLSRKQLLGRPIREAVADSTHLSEAGWPLEIIESLHKVIDTGETCTMEALETDTRTVDPASGGKDYWRAECSPVVNEQRETELILHTLFDVTEQVRSEKKLQRSLERYHFATKATRDAIWEWNLKTDTVIWGEGYQTRFGYSDADISNPDPNWPDNLHPYDRERIQRHLKAVIEGKGNIWRDEYRFRRADGSYAMVEDHGFVIRDKNGQAVRMIGAMRDMTEERELKALLEQAHQMARIGGWELDLSENTIWLSPVTKQIHEVPHDFEPDLETGINFYLEGEHRDSIRQALDEAIEQGTPWDLELQIVTAKGTPRWIRTKGQPEFVDGRCVRLYGIFQDIDKLKRAQLERERANRERYRILDRVTEGFFGLDSEYRVTFWNREAERITGVTHEQVIDNNLWDAFPEARPLKFFNEYKHAFRTQTHRRFEEFFPPIDSWLEVNVYPSPEGLSVFFRDVTDRKHLEHQLRERIREQKCLYRISILDEQRLSVDELLQQAVTIIPEGFQFPGIASASIRWGEREFQSPGFRQSPWGLAIRSRRLDEFQLLIEVYYSEDLSGGGIALFLPEESRLLETLGGLLSMKIERILQNEQLHSSLKEKEILLAEIHHRVKNNLAVVAGLMELQITGSENPELTDQLNKAILRIRSIADIHEHLYRSESFSRLDLAANISTLVSKIIDEFHQGVAIDYSVDCEPLDININQAIPLTLIVNEVLTNILKYAFIGHKRGSIRIHISEQNNRLKFDVTDTGNRLPEEFPKLDKGTLGHLLIDVLSKQLKAEYNYKSTGEGTTFTLTFEKTDIRGIGSYLIR